MTVLSESDVVAALRAAGCVFAEDEARLLIDAARTPDDLDRLVQHRAAGLPLEHVLGWTEFSGLRIVVAPGVFVPRRRTELLVREAMRLAPRGAVVVDLCTGSGAVAASLGAHARVGELHAVDVDPAAVRCARRNVEPRGRVHQGDLYDALPRRLHGHVDLLTANAPYVPTDALPLMPREARDHEPAVALDGGADGLDVHRRIAAGASHWLTPGGHVLIETSEQQAAATADLLTQAGLASRLVRDPGIGATVAVGTKPPAYHEHQG